MTKKGRGEEINFKSSFDGDVFPGTLYVKLLDNDHETEPAKEMAF